MHESDSPDAQIVKPQNFLATTDCNGITCVILLPKYQKIAQGRRPC
jgi:hypothetical protein